ncbi:MAG: hypothetical protein P1U63_03370 [Coxiellaceae bacterium]|nr:hypothetical protein [Coxiellaceae bacterium]
MSLFEITDDDNQLLHNRCSKNTAGLSRLAYDQAALTVGWVATAVGVIIQAMVQVQYNVDYDSTVDVKPPSSVLPAVAVVSVLAIAVRLMLWSMSSSRQLEKAIGLPAAIKQEKPKNNRTLSALTYFFVANRAVTIPLYTLMLPIAYSVIYQPLVEKSSEKCGYFGAEALECSFNFMKDNMLQVCNVAWPTLAVTSTILLLDTILVWCGKHPSQVEAAVNPEAQPLNESAGESTVAHC